jgi:hypothetical protein
LFGGWSVRPPPHTPKCGLLHGKYQRASKLLLTIVPLFGIITGLMKNN